MLRGTAHRHCGRTPVFRLQNDGDAQEWQVVETADVCLGDEVTLTFTIEGRPRTKKTSNRLIRAGSFTKILPSKAFEEWNKSAQLQLAKVRSKARVRLPITEPVNCAAVFFRDANRGDATGFMQALADALQEGRIIANDSQIRSWNCPVLPMQKDADRPRVEVTLTVLEGL